MCIWIHTTSGYMQCRMYKRLGYHSKQLQTTCGAGCMNDLDSTASNYRPRAVQDVRTTWILSLVGAAVSIMSVATNRGLLWQNTRFVTTKVCCNKTFVATKLCLLRQNIFVATKVLSRQISVTPNMFVTTKVVSWQAYFCHNKRCVLSWQIHSCSKTFVMTKLFL